MRSDEATGATGAGGGRAVFLDRDGVLNRIVERDGRPGSPRTLAEFELYHDAPGAADRLRSAGWRVFVITNQPDLARGRMARTELEAMMQVVRERIAPDEALFCPHDDADGCACRKPKPGMIRALAERWGIDLTASYVVGDTWKDMEAGRAAGCRTILLRRPYNEDTPSDLAAETLAGAAELILGADESR